MEQLTKRLPFNDLNQKYVASIMPPSWPDGTYYGWRPCMEWCCETFGYNQNETVGSGRNWRYVGEGVFEFDREEDCLIFLMRWSS